MYVFTSSFLLHPQKLAAEDILPEVPKTYTKLELLDKVYQYAEIHKNSPKTIIATINCENKDWDPNLQSRIINKQGVREESYGLAQIYLPAHPNITKAQATDPDFALDYIAQHLGRDDSWSCYKKNS